jgi:hypothetical protein
MKLAKLAAAAVLVVGGAAQAALLEGRTLAYLYFFPDLETPYEFAPNGHYVVGPGVEIVDFVDDGGGSIDLSDTQLRIVFQDIELDAAAFNGLRLSDVAGSIDAFAAVRVDPASTVVFDPSRITHDADNLWLDFQSLEFTTGQELVLNISAVPEPSAWILMLAGLAVVARAAPRRGR